MILISIQPFAPKKLFALAATIACLSTASCFADAMYLSARAETSVRPARQAPVADSVSVDFSRRGYQEVAVGYWRSDLMACAR